MAAAEAGSSAEDAIDYYFLDGFFIDKPPEKFSCPICLSPVQREAHLTKCCGRHFCFPCIFRLVYEKPCPMCKANLLIIFPNKERQREINSLKVCCPVKVSGAVSKEVKTPEVESDKAASDKAASDKAASDKAACSEEFSKDKNVADLSLSSCEWSGELSQVENHLRERHEGDERWKPFLDAANSSFYSSGATLDTSTNQIRYHGNHARYRHGRGRCQRFNQQLNRRLREISLGDRAHRSEDPSLALPELQPVPVVLHHEMNTSLYYRPHTEFNRVDDVLGATSANQAHQSYLENALMLSGPVHSTFQSDRRYSNGNVSAHTMARRGEPRRPPSRLGFYDLPAYAGERPIDSAFFFIESDGGNVTQGGRFVINTDRSVGAPSTMVEPDAGNQRLQMIYELPESLRQSNPESTTEYHQAGPLPARQFHYQHPSFPAAHYYQSLPPTHQPQSMPPAHPSSRFLPHHHQHSLGPIPVHVPFHPVPASMLPGYSYPRPPVRHPRPGPPHIR